MMHFKISIKFITQFAELLLKWILKILHSNVIATEIVNGNWCVHLKFYYGTKQV